MSDEDSCSDGRGESIKEGSMIGATGRVWFPYCRCAAGKGVVYYLGLLAFGVCLWVGSCFGVTTGSIAVLGVIPDTGTKDLGGS